MISARNGVVLTTLVAAALGSWYLARQDRPQESADAVDVAQVVATMTRNGANARTLIAALPALLKGPQSDCGKGCTHALDGAIMTAPAKRDRDLMAKLETVAGRVLK